MLSLLAQPDSAVALATLSLLEIVLGVDNLVVLSIFVGQLPPTRQRAGRLIGLSLAMLTRLALLFSIVWLTGLRAPWFTLLGHGISAHDLILGIGGLILLAQSVTEIHTTLERAAAPSTARVRARRGLAVVVFQIALIDIMFLARLGVYGGWARTARSGCPIMAAAIVISIMVMMWVSGPVTALVERYPTVKVLALAFVVLIGSALIGQALGFEIPKGYLYFAMAFAVGRRIDQYPPAPAARAAPLGGCRSRYRLASPGTTQPAVRVAIAEIQREANYAPDDQAPPGGRRQRIGHAAQNTTPTVATNQTAGTLNGRGRSGRVLRNTSTPMHTTIKATSVPMETSSPRIPMGSSPPKVAASTPVMSVATCGVLNRGCTAPKNCGSRPSCDIVSQMRACGMIMVMMTEVRPASAPQSTQIRSHASCLCASSATGTGAASLSCAYGTSPVITLDISMYRTVQIPRLPSMPMGMLRAGFLASCATVETPSKPI